MQTLEKPINGVEDIERQRKREKKAAQARHNGSNSKGPISLDGKRNSSRNAIRHGLTANAHTLLTMEDPAEYDEVYNAFVDKFRPADKAEMRLVEKLANLDWRLERFVMLETCALNMGAEINVRDIQARFEHIDGIGFILEGWKKTESASKIADLFAATWQRCRTSSTQRSATFATSSATASP